MASGRVQIQEETLRRATDFRDGNIVDVSSLDELKAAVAAGKWARGPWAGAPRPAAGRPSRQVLTACIWCFGVPETS